jgi:hypothetical protein
MAIGIPITTTGDPTVIIGTPVPGGGTPLQGLVVLISHRATAVTQGVNHTHVLNVELWELLGTDADYHVLLDTKTLDVDDTTASASEALLWTSVLEDWVAATFIPYDAASDMDTGFVEIRVRDILMLKLSPKNSVHANSQGVDCTLDINDGTASTVCGLVFNGNSHTDTAGTRSGLQCRSFGGQIVRTTELSEQPINVGASDIVATYGGGVNIGTMGEEPRVVPSVVTGSGPTPAGGNVLMFPMTFAPSTGITDWPYPSPNAPRNYMFWIDGENAGVINPIERTHGNWLNVSNTTTFGKCRVTARETWRGRAMLANYSGNQAAIFLAKVGDPTNWTIGGPDPARAFSLDGSNSIGVAADAVTAIQPVSDSICMFGCATRAYYLSGDPGIDGVFREVPDKGGVLGPRAICRGTEGRVFGMSAGGVRMWAFSGNGVVQSQLITDKRVSQILDRVSTLDTNLELNYEAATGWVHIFLHPRNGEQGTHLIFDVEDNTFHPVEYPEPWGPFVACETVGQEFDDKRILMGCRDGLIRRFITLKPDDDGQRIRVRGGMPVVESADGMRETLVTEVQASAARGSGPVVFSIRTAATAAELLEQDWDTTDPAVSWTWFADGKQFQDAIDPGCGGGAVQLCFEQDSAVHTFALDRLNMNVMEGSLRRV